MNHRKRLALALLTVATMLAVPTTRADEAPLPDRRLMDVPYGKHVRQRFDVYLPAHPARAPIVLMVHGGAWMVGSRTGPGVVENKMRHWVGQGWIFVSTGYRLYPEAGPMTQAEDVAGALARVQALAADWGGDGSRVVLMGHSAGAHLVALLGAAPDIARAQGAMPWRATVSIDSGAVDLPRLMSMRHPALYDKVFGSDPAAWASVSPAQRVTAQATPMLMICSTRRLDDPCLQARRFAQRAAPLGIDVRVLGQNLTHAQINAELGLPGAYTDAVDAFLAEVTKRPG